MDTKMNNGLQTNASGRALPKIILAINDTDIQLMVDLILKVKDFISLIKVGLQFFIAHGMDGVIELHRLTGVYVFLDIKLYDTPDTVFSAVRNTISPCIKILTVHASGGATMLKKAHKAVKLTCSDLQLSAVTVLSSSNSSEKKAVSRAGLAFWAGFNMVVCPVCYVEPIKYALPKMKVISPGIRLEGKKNDQFFVATPLMATKAGSDYIVIGREVTEAPCPIERMEDIYRNMNS